MLLTNGMLEQQQKRAGKNMIYLPGLMEAPGFCSGGKLVEAMCCLVQMDTGILMISAFRRAPWSYLYTWTGAVSSDWNNSNNWDSDLPLIRTSMSLFQEEP